MPIDLRSDTVTKPDAAMRQAMADAEVGDDQYGEDPTVIALQDEAAALLGKEAGLFLPSGTMANQVALRVLTRHGDDVVVGWESHIVFHETGASAAISGVQFTEVGRGPFGADELRAAIKPRGHVIYPPTTLVVVENTHNRSGGRLFTRAMSEEIGAAARAAGVASYLDGARIFNAAVALGETEAALSAPFDLVGISLSKGLGAPVGSVLAGSREHIDTARRYRRMLGGAMRQSGVIAAAGLVALRNNRGRLGEDHANAKLIATRLAGAKGVVLDPADVVTNLVVARLADGVSAYDVTEACRREGVLLFPFSQSILRLATHLEVDEAACRRAADIIAQAIEANA